MYYTIIHISWRLQGFSCIFIDSGVAAQALLSFSLGNRPGFCEPDISYILPLILLSVFGDGFGDECERSILNARIRGSCGPVTHGHFGYIRGRYLITVSLRVCSGPQQARFFAWILALAEISSFTEPLAYTAPCTFVSFSITRGFEGRATTINTSTRSTY